MNDKKYVAFFKDSKKDYILKVGSEVELKKDYNNDYDSEAIIVNVINVGKVGYVANSVETVPKGCYSAGRIYDTFDNSIRGFIKFIVNDIAIVELEICQEDSDKELMMFVSILEDLFDDGRS